MRNAKPARIARRRLALLALALALVPLAVASPALAECDTSTWPGLTGIEMYHGWTFTMLNLTPYDLKILPSATTAISGFPYNKVIPPANTKKKTDGGTSSTVALSVWDSKSGADWPDACQVHVDFQIGDSTAYNFSVWFLKDGAKSRVDTGDYDYIKYAKLGKLSATSTWKYQMDNAMHAGYYATDTHERGEALMVAVSNDSKFVVSLYRTENDKHDLTLVVTWLDPTAGYTNKSRKLYWLLN